MRRFRVILLWLAILVLLNLAELALVGAFLTTEDAYGMFNTLPMAAFLVFFLLLLAAGFFAFKRLVYSPGLLMIHLGCLVALFGAMQSSELGHYLAKSLRLPGYPKIRKGQMYIRVGDASSDVIVDAETEAKRTLPFSVNAKDFWIESYGPWKLRLLRPDTVKADGTEIPSRVKEIEWVKGEAVDLPPTDVRRQTVQLMFERLWLDPIASVPSDTRLKVLEYYDGAQVEFEKAVPAELRIGDAPEELTAVLPAEVGRTVTLREPEMTLRVKRLFTRFSIGIGPDGQRQFTNTGLVLNPVMAVSAERPNAEPVVYYFFAFQDIGHSGRDLGVPFAQFVHPAVDGATEDDESRWPAMHVEIQHAGGTTREWLTVQPFNLALDIPLSMLMEPGERGAVLVSPEDPHYQELAAEAARAVPTLRLMAPRGHGDIKDYKSHLRVPGRDGYLAEKVIEVNDPLHFGGYHFYQQSYDTRNENYTVLSVRSDSGLLTVYVGYGLLGVGVFWLFWFQPAIMGLVRWGVGK